MIMSLMNTSHNLNKSDLWEKYSFWSIGNRILSRRPPLPRYKTIVLEPLQGRRRVIIHPYMHPNFNKRCQILGFL